MRPKGHPDIGPNEQTLACRARAGRPRARIGAWLPILAVLSSGRAAASPGKEVCDLRAVELVWQECVPTGLVLRGVCAPVQIEASDNLGTPRPGYFYFACQGENCRSAAERIVQAAHDAPQTCWNFYVATFRSATAPLALPEPSIDYPINWAGCERLKNYEATPVSSPSSLDHRKTPVGCDSDADAGIADGMDGGVLVDAAPATPVSPLGAAGASPPLGAAGASPTGAVMLSPPRGGGPGSMETRAAAGTLATTREPPARGPEMTTIEPNTAPSQPTGTGCTAVQRGALRLRDVLDALALLCGCVALRFRTRRRLRQ